MKDSINIKDVGVSYSVNHSKVFNDLNIPLISNVFVQVYKDGKELESFNIHNLVMNSGLTEVAKMISGVGTTAIFNYMAVGTGSTAVAATQTALVTEVMRQVDSTISLGTTNVSNDTAVFVNTFAFSTTYTLREAGIFNASSGGIMLARVVYGVVTVSDGSEFKITWKIVT